MNKLGLILFISVFGHLMIKNGVIASEKSTHTVHAALMGTDFYLNIILEDSTKAKEILGAGIDMIRDVEAEISSWQPNSLTTAINQNAGIKPIKVSNDLFYLIKRSLFLSSVTEGLFDISYASLDKVWYFHKKMTRFPSQQEIDSLKAVVDYKKIELDENAKTVFLTEKGMKIGFGAIGKGYVANRVKALFIEKGVKAGLINAGGDLIAWGKQEDNTPWTIAIPDPENKKQVLAYFPIGDEAVVTSGNYERYIEHEGKRYTHIINPKTGMPAEGLESVTVICPDAELADGLATALFLMEPAEAITFVNGLLNIECIIVDTKHQLYTSENINLNYE